MTDDNSVTFSSVFRATTIAASAGDPDPTFGPIPATVWSVVEANTGIICACMPMLRSPFVRLFGPLLGSRKSTIGHRSFQLSARQHPTDAAFHASGKVHGLRELSRSDSEQVIIEADDISVGKSDLPQRRESVILVTNGFSVMSEEEERSSPAKSGGEDELKGDRKPAFLHI